MQNYEAVKMWAAGVNIDKAIDELAAFQEKYQWAKLPAVTQALLKLSEGLPKLTHMITHQEKENRIHAHILEVSQKADDAILHAVAAKLGYDIDTPSEDERRSDTRA